jgi:protein required for attachment to host cells
VNTLWILVAQSSQATIYAMDSTGKELTEIEHFDHADSRRHAREITSDLPGRTVGGDGSHHALEAKTAIKEEEAILFAQQINKYLEECRGKRQFARLAIMAAPAFLGHLRKHMNEQVAKLVVHEIRKNLDQDDVAQIHAHLPAQL